MPTVSPDGRTYTFRIRPGFRFSPPSNEPVTAETFRLHDRADALAARAGLPGLRPGIVGVDAYRAPSTRGGRRTSPGSAPAA